MTQFSISDVAFTGFAVVRHRPRAVLVWVVALVLISGSYSAIVTTQFGPVMLQMSSLSSTQRQDPAQAMALLNQLAPLYAVSLLYSLIIYPFLFATMNRAVLRPKDSAFGYIRFGADEFRQLGLVLMYMGLILASWIGATIIGTIVAIAIGAATQQAVLGLFITLGLLIVAYIYFGVRLSLASAETFASGKISLFGSWTLTRGRFWPVFGAYFLATMLFVIVALLGTLVVVAISAAMGGGQDLAAAFLHPQSNPAPLFSPARIAQVILSAALSAITWPLVMTPAPAIYKAIVADRSSVADVF